MNNNYYWSLIAASKKKLPPIWVEYIVARAGDFNLPSYDTIQENIVADTDHLASVQLYDSDNELTANLRPCLSTEKGHYLEGCLYDVVKKKFYYSQNAVVKYGDIVREVEYIESTGTQYIDTGIIGNDRTGFYIDAQKTHNNETDSFILGSRLNMSDTRFSVDVDHSGTINGQLLLGWNIITPKEKRVLCDLNRFTISVNYLNDRICLIDNNINNDYTQQLGTTLVDQNPRNLIVFASNLPTGISYFWYGKVWSIKITQESNIVRDFIPCINPSGVVCMYDFISGQFFTNAGTGEFIAGKDVNDLFNVVEKEGVFLNRTTGDGLNVKDKSLAHITSIKGNTLIFNQLLKEGKVVDMGLPSGTLWATSNIDVTQEDGFAASPFQYGCTMFSWGNVDGHNTPASGTTFDYNWGSVNAAEPWYEGQPYGNTKGNTLKGNIPVGEEFDAVRANLGELWRMPLSTEFWELINGCIYIDATGTEIPAATTDKRVTVNGIMGLYLQSKTNGNRLFFSASGYGNGSSWFSYGAGGNYWSSSFYSSSQARRLSFDSGGVRPQFNYYRCNGFAVRAVLKPSNIITTGSNNHKYYIKNNKNIFDLTEMFGAGNEPATAKEFESMFPADYYDYDAGSLLNVNAGGMKSTNIEKTKWDSLYFVDDAHTLSSLTGKAEGSSVSEVIFPEGMKSAGSIYDELTDVKDGCFTKAINRLGAVDLGNLSWSYVSSLQLFCAQINNAKLIWNLATITSSKYIKKSTQGNPSDGQYTFIVGFQTSGVNSILIKDINYTDVPTFKTTLSGLKLYYELKTPITYTLDTPVPCNYKVWKGGAESIVPENTEALTAPVDMNVKYIVEEDE